MQFLILVALLSGVANAFSTDLLYWPVGSPQPSILAHVSYDPASLNSNVISYHPPNDPSDDLVRLGLYTSATSKKQWVGSLVSLSSLASEQLTFRLHLDSSNEPYAVSLSTSSTTHAAGPEVQLIWNESGPQPQLNRPVIVGPDGQDPDQPEEKTLFQKYWWVLLIITFLSMSGGGEGQ